MHSPKEASGFLVSQLASQHWCPAQRLPEQAEKQIGAWGSPGALGQEEPGGVFWFCMSLLKPADLAFSAVCLTVVVMSPKCHLYSKIFGTQQDGM